MAVRVTHRDISISVGVLVLMNQTKSVTKFMKQSSVGEAVLRQINVLTLSCVTQSRGAAEMKAKV